MILYMYYICIIIFLKIIIISNIYIIYTLSHHFSVIFLRFNNHYFIYSNPIIFHENFIIAMSCPKSLIHAVINFNDKRHGMYDMYYNDWNHHVLRYHPRSTRKRLSTFPRATSRERKFSFIYFSYVIVYTQYSIHTWIHARGLPIVTHVIVFLVQGVPKLSSKHKLIC